MAGIVKRTLALAGAATIVAGIFAGGCSGGTTTPTDGGGGDTGGGGGDAAGDTGKPDTGKPDSGKMDTGASQCPTPMMLGTYTPPAFVSPSAVQNVCNSTQVQQFWDNCRAPQATSSTCMTWKNANTSCYGCLLTQKTDSTWGPLVMDNGITFINTSGCLALLGATTCAHDDQALGMCEEAACDPVCMVTDFFDPNHQSTLQQWQACSMAATMGDCMSFVTQVNNNCPVDAGTAAATCFNFQSFQDAYFLYAPMFCSGGG